MTSWVRLLGEAVATATCVIVVVAGVRHCTASSIGVRQTAEGVQLEPSVGIDFSAKPRTVILFLQSGCTFCQASASFYRRLLAGDRMHAQVIVAAPVIDAGLRAYLAAREVEPDAVVYVEQRELPVASTPTVLLVDADGVVTYRWVGLLNAEQEADVLTAVYGRGGATDNPGHRAPPGGVLQRVR